MSDADDLSNAKGGAVFVGDTRTKHGYSEMDVDAGQTVELGEVQGEKKIISSSSAGSTPRHLMRTHWALTGLMTVGMIMGTGVLALPAAVSGLGYGLGITLCVLFGLLAGYIGTILGEARNRFAPRATSFAMLSSKIVGPRLAKFTKHAMYVNWWSVLPLYLLTAVESLRNAFYWVGGRVCGYSWGWVVVGVLILPVQMRSYHSISGIVAVSDAAVIVVIILILAVLASEGQNTPEGFTHHNGPPPGSFLDRYNNVSAFLFAYQGQSVFLEIMAEMKNPNYWTRALWLGQAVMIPTYTVTAGVGYYLLGDSAPGFLPAALPDNAAKTVINLLLFFHVVIAYLVHNQPLCQGIEAFLFPSERVSRSDGKSFDQDSGVANRDARDASNEIKAVSNAADSPIIADHNNTANAKHHFVISTVILLSAYLVANLIPFFEELVGILGAAFGSPILLFYPPLFYIRGMQKKGYPIPTFHRVLCSVCIYILFPFTFFIGIIAAFKSLGERWADEGRPFDCNLGSS
mmetsp:Transcript_378/g.947  ORF Transcript_378/g.947 Transcript_378/m.947 type:complete len:517 (-) Transcript_378:359-1909(-)|eukprot:CAMPEP_0114496806 /NCGR_PEP_ID=MMETSP0109-20121206/5969_1 /TAXON_ID=29199 /ORGANISM="Chlorarachnion reptans, Strain CCCM449" /LENGTH=516 /DNA_ID=CAMNT_0001674109 /DNA_START=181 /DNA_END=1731 /DNA_ORIENTATION=-